MTAVESTFAEWLRRQRRQLDLTQAELAQRAGCSVMTIRKLERAELRPSKQLAELLARALNIAPAHQAVVVAFARGTGAYPQLDVAPSTPAFPMHPIDLSLCQHNLEAPTTPLVGRERELADLQQLFVRPDVRLVTILGAGGMGKTHLAQEVARQYRERTHAAVFFVALAPLAVAEGLTTAIIDALGYPLQQDRRSPEQQLFDYIQQKQLLFVLDNFEHLLTGAGLVNAMLRVAPGVKILVTSREPLSLSSETLYRLGSLAYPDQAITTDVLTYAAVKLLLERIRHLLPAFEPSAVDQEALVRICHLVGGMPLGILLAASWINLLPLQAIADEISQSLDFLEAELRDLPERHRSLRGVFVHSWRRLTDAERTIFMQLAVFRGGFTRQAAQQVTGASLHQLRTLVNQSLLQVDNDERYTLHELLRQYAEAELTTTGQRAAAATRHCAYYADLLAQSAGDRKGPRQAALLTLIESEHDNLRTAWAWAIAQRDSERVAQMRESLGFFYEWRGRLQEGERTFAQAVDAFAATQDNPEPSALPRLLTWQATFCHLLGKQAKAVQLLYAALALVDGCQGADQAVHLARAAILHGLGQYVYATGDRREAHRLFAESLACYQRHNDPWGAATVRLSIQKIERSLASFGNPLQHQHAAETAMTRVLESVSIFRALGDHAHLATALDALGTVLLYLGQAQAAQAALTECLALHQALGTMNSSYISTLIAMATSYEFVGLYEQASLRAQEALRLAQAVGDAYCMRRACCVLSSVALAQQRYADVQSSFQEEWQLLTLGQFWNSSTIVQLVNCGLANYRCGDFTQAAKQLGEALRGGQTLHALRGVVHGLLLGALLLVAQGKVALAVEIHALARCYPVVANCHWCEEVAGHELTALAATLPAESVAAAHARGQASDLVSTIANLLVELAPHR